MSFSSQGRIRRRVSLIAVGGLAATSLALVATTSPAQAAPVDVQILGTNDFHGRLEANISPSRDTWEAGAAQFAAAAVQLRSENPNTVFAAAGDLIGASTFASFIQQDKPTLDALNLAELDVSAAGNHEFDAGLDDLTQRVMQPYDATTNPFGGAEWQYLAANVRRTSDNSYALPDVTASPGTSDGGTWTTNMGGVEVGFIGTVTEDLPSLVTPSGIADVRVTSIIDETNAAADRLKADGADLIVMLTHEGAAQTTLASAQDTSTAFGRIVAGVDSDVDAIISGHTHLAYNHSINGRPVVSAGQYGTNLNKLVFTVDPDTDSVTVKSQEIVRAHDVVITDPAANTVRTEVTGIVTAAVTEAEVLGARPLGKIGAGLLRARLADGTTENRGGESTLGNLVAEAQRWATRTPESGAAQIAFMNPGGLRQDMLGLNADGYPATLTFKQAAVVQPFANTLVNMSLTGAQLKTVLEQQWQRDGAGNVPSRPFLRLGVSDGFTSTFDPARAEGDRITGMWLDGVAIVPGSTYSVTVNSFLASGGDNFREFANGAGARDTGKSDLNAMVDFMAQYATAPLEVDYAQRQVGMSFPKKAPSVYRPGDRLEFDVSSLLMTAPGEPRDRRVQVKLADTVITTAAVDNTVEAEPTDESGQSIIGVRIPAYLGVPKSLTLVGTTTGTQITVPVRLATVKAPAKVAVKVTPKKIRRNKTRAKVHVTVTSKAAVTGKVAIKVGGRKAITTTLRNGRATVRLQRFGREGSHRITVTYLGNTLVKKATKHVTVRVVRR